MELFSSQPDLSLQISPPDMTPASGCRKPDEDMDLGFLRSNSMTTALMEKAESNTSEIKVLAVEVPHKKEHERSTDAVDKRTPRPLCACCGALGRP
ncbi:hypothetical protein BHE74_00030932 [Ensete ventricosum]|uniref:Uncharacterized protein n=1 Tax=Ensete ventricosum TaxID=4639 RepID=A0A426YLV8_ENSVE|nr:hypothetical protein B296_00029662 [Ensete ventricosum]RWW61964.1 hypothetical protein BHE74_00030932 [Ensete ventricosum]